MADFRDAIVNIRTRCPGCFDQGFPMYLRAAATAFTALTAAILLMACDQGSGPGESDPRELLTGQGWMVKSHTVEPGLELVEGELPVTDMLASRAGCVKDDIHRFSKSGDYTIDDGGTRCTYDEMVGLELNLLWNLDAEGSKITFTNDGRPVNQSWMIETLSNKTLKVKLISSEEWVDGKSHTEWLEFRAN